MGIAAMLAAAATLCTPTGAQGAVVEFIHGLLDSMNSEWFRQRQV
jgi:hypothetical protein